MNDDSQRQATRSLSISIGNSGVRGLSRPRATGSATIRRRDSAVVHDKPDGEILKTDVNGAGISKIGSTDGAST
jgi:hypothetical protein